MSFEVGVSPQGMGSGAPQGRPGLRPGALLALLLGIGLFTASLIGVSEAMRYVIETNGGYCASGGPYEIADGHECDGGAIGLLVGGIFAMLLGGAVALAGSGTYLGAQGMGLSGLLWAALFGLLGWNFIEFGFSPPDNLTNDPPVWGFVIPGVVFWMMAAPGLVAPVAALRWRRQDPESTTPANGIVMATGAGVPEVAPPPARPAPLLPWAAALTFGALAGAALGSWISGLVL